MRARLQRLLADARGAGPRRGSCSPARPASGTSSGSSCSALLLRADGWQSPTSAPTRRSADATRPTPSSVRRAAALPQRHHAASTSATLSASWRGPPRAGYTLAARRRLRPATASRAGLGAFHVHDHASGSLGAQAATPHRDEPARSRRRPPARRPRSSGRWLEPLDRRLFRSDYSDVAVLGKFVTTGRAGARPASLLHAANGARVRPRLPRGEASVRRLGGRAGACRARRAVSAVGARRPVPPCAREARVPKLLTPRAFGQATLRHAVFGAVLGKLT